MNAKVPRSSCSETNAVVINKSTIVFNQPERRRRLEGFM